MVGACTLFIFRVGAAGVHALAPFCICVRIFGMLNIFPFGEAMSESRLIRILNKLGITAGNVNIYLFAVNHFFGLENALTGIQNSAGSCAGCFNYNAVVHVMTENGSIIVPVGKSAALAGINCVTPFLAGGSNNSRNKTVVAGCGNFNIVGSAAILTVSYLLTGSSAGGLCQSLIVAPVMIARSRKNK